MLKSTTYRLNIIHRIAFESLFNFVKEQEAWEKVWLNTALVASGAASIAAAAVAAARSQIPRRARRLGRKLGCALQDFECRTTVV